MCFILERWLSNDGALAVQEYPNLPLPGLFASCSLKYDSAYNFPWHEFYLSASWGHYQKDSKCQNMSSLFTFPCLIFFPLRLSWSG